MSERRSACMLKFVQSEWFRHESDMRTRCPGSIGRAGGVIQKVNAVSRDACCCYGSLI